MDPSENTHKVEGGLHLEAYSVEIPLERLKLGADNLRYDVLISPEFVKITDHIVLQMVMKHSRASKPLITLRKDNWHREISLFRETCRKLMTNALNQAKSLREVQIDYLAQIAMVKLLIERVNNRLEAAFQHFKNVVRKQEVSHRSESHLKLREEVLEITKRRNIITRDVCTELFVHFNEARKDIDELRALNFGEEWLLPEELFDNPLLYTDFHPDDFFMMENYVLVGHRGEDCLNYNTVFGLLRSFLNAVLEDERSPADTAALMGEIGAYGQTADSSFNTIADRLLKNPKNVDRLFNYPETRRELAKKRKANEDRTHLKSLKARVKAQKALSGKAYKMFHRENMLRGIAAAYEIEGAVKSCCPPLMPQDVLRFTAYPRSRKRIARKIMRFRPYSEKPMSLAELKKTASRIKWLSRRETQRRMIRFLNDFIRYHRDLCNCRLYKETADCINLPEEQKDIRLSRDNYTLYEFILKREQIAQKKPVINHAVLKADVRGSTGIIEQMKQKGLNPASNFSLNFFEPINNLISVFGAEKVFIEGDAVILSVFEHEDAPDRWYGVARACGLAANILLVVKRLNHKNRKKNLPRLDLGIGISFSPSAPTFFYDGNNQIMISPAINEADALSECDHALRRRFKEARLPFNLYVYQLDTSEMEGAEFLLSPMLRYNVMGIELSTSGFEKLFDEIYLKRIEAKLPALQKAPVVIYTGKFPTVSGGYQRIIVREADIPLVSPRDFSIKQLTGRKYYEICTHPALYEYVKPLEKQH
ncbi:MAG: hypothetical protein R6T92_04360 [Desulfosalsimonadaceae bacterium]